MVLRLLLADGRSVTAVYRYREAICRDVAFSQGHHASNIKEHTLGGGGQYIIRSGSYSRLKMMLFLGTSVHPYLNLLKNKITR